MGIGASSSSENTVKNNTVNKSSLELLNKSVNSYVSNTVTKNASTCAASSSQIVENSVGKIIVSGDNNKGVLDIDSVQDSEVNLQCIQESLQQINLGNEIATSIMQQLTQKVDNSTIAKLVTSSEAKNVQGFGANPFASSNSKVKVNTENTTINETNRKLSNLISNSVANNVDATNISDCFIKNTQSQINKIGNVKLLGEGNVLNLKLSSNQLAKSFATCKQLNDQTSKITNQIATALGLKIVDDIKNTTKTDSKAISSATVKTTGVEGIFDAVSGAFNNLFGMIASVSSIIFIMIIVLAVVMKKKGSVKKDPETGKWSVGIDGVGEVNNLKFSKKSLAKQFGVTIPTELESASISIASDASSSEDASDSEDAPDDMQENNYSDNNTQNE